MYSALECRLYRVAGQDLKTAIVTTSDVQLPLFTNIFSSSHASFDCHYPIHLWSSQLHSHANDWSINKSTFWTCTYNLMIISLIIRKTFLILETCTPGVCHKSWISDKRHHQEIGQTHRSRKLSWVDRKWWSQAWRNWNKDCRRSILIALAFHTHTGESVSF